MSVNTKDLRKALRRLVEAIADEADKNEAFANKLRDFLPIIEDTTNAANEKEQSGDPYQVYQSQGEEGLKNWLETLQLNELKQIVRDHRLDSTRNSDKWKTKERFIQLIAQRVPARSKQGDVFRHYGTPSRLQTVQSDPKEGSNAR